MENLSDKTFNEAYAKGYQWGLSPAFKSIEEIEDFISLDYNDAFISGFDSGRQEYEKYNGPIADGIPHRILTQKILSDYMQIGRIGMPLDMKDFNPEQKARIRKYYSVGLKHFTGDNDITLCTVLAKLGIV